MFKVITLLSLVTITAFGDADFDTLIAQAETGDAEAQYELGMAYRKGVTGSAPSTPVAERPARDH